MTNLCQQCRVRPALAARGTRSHSHKRGRRLSRGDHDMCRQCWNSNRESGRARPARGRFDGVLDDLLAAAKAGGSQDSAGEPRRRWIGPMGRIPTSAEVDAWLGRVA